MIDLSFSIVVCSLVAIATGIVTAHALFLMAQFLPESKGYMWRAASKIRRFLLKFFALEFLFAFVILTLTAMVVSYAHYLYILGFNLGIVTVAVATPVTLERILLPKKRMSVAKLRRRSSRIMLNIGLRYRFAWAIESCRQQDVYDCQEAGWGLGIAPSEIGRRIRTLYETAKLDIAKDRKDNSLLAYDVNHNSWEKFYLLVRHMGRRRLRDFIANPPESPIMGWNRSERRRIFGAAKDRKTARERWTATKRVYDTIRDSALSETALRRELLARSPEVGLEAMSRLEQAREKYCDLIDKKFASKLTSEEQIELTRLEVFLGEAEEHLYSPTIKKLKEIRNALSLEQ